jgi:hypothetical protein
MSVPWATWSSLHGRFIKKRTDVAVACFVKGSYYETSANIMIRKFAEHNPEINVFVFTDYKEIGSPSHQEIPYAFKYYAVQKVHSMGYRTVLWCDSVLKLQKPIDPVLREIAVVGVYLQKDGWACGTWANDKCLDYFGVSRDEAMNISSIWACFMGFDFANPVAREFLTRWKAAMDAGAFHGSHTNEDRRQSLDSRCRGYRHDQSCAELIAYQMKLPLSPQRASCVPINDAAIYFIGRGF